MDRQDKNTYSMKFQMIKQKKNVQKEEITSYFKNRR